MCQSVCSYAVTRTANYVECLFPCLRGAAPKLGFPLEQECDGVQDHFLRLDDRNAISTTLAVNELSEAYGQEIFSLRLPYAQSMTRLEPLISHHYISPSPQIRARRNKTTLKMTTMKWLCRSTLNDSTSDGLRSMELSLKQQTLCCSRVWRT